MKYSCAYDRSNCLAQNDLWLCVDIQDLLQSSWYISYALIGNAV